MVTTVQAVQTLIVSLLQIRVLGCELFSVKSPTFEFSSAHTADHSGTTADTKRRMNAE